MAVACAKVVAVAYDDKGKIIGSGTGLVNLPVKGSATVDIEMEKTAARPAKGILFPALPGSW